MVHLRVDIVGKVVFFMKTYLPKKDTFILEITILFNRFPKGDFQLPALEIAENARKVTWGSFSTFACKRRITKYFYVKPD